ncbi:hypothetical protein COT29_00605 [Candidatus Micrarchaeota archaeon CG08_land_8_20_14_0_20_59_11]|nr:MAG: hypothetical protein COT29_00605 [Candidatus Micrarchaeota archaeon CG08_land_8_20_14_0_20_59_11]
MAKPFIFSKHYREDKDIDVDMARDCVNTGRKRLDGEPDKFKAIKKYRKGELVVVFRDDGECIFVITAFWNKRG